MMDVQAKEYILSAIVERALRRTAEPDEILPHLDEPVLARALEIVVHGRDDVDPSPYIIESLPNFGRALPSLQRDDR